MPAEKQVKNNGTYEILHDKAVKAFFRARTIPFWAAGLNIAGIILLIIFFFQNLTDGSIPATFLLNGFSLWLKELIFININTSDPVDYVWRIILFTIVGFAISAMIILIGYWALRPIRRKVIIANLVTQVISLVLTISYSLFLFFYYHADRPGNLQDFVFSAAVQGIISYFSLNLLLTHDKVIALEKQFAGQNITITETKIFNIDDINKTKKEEKDYDFLKK